MASESGVARDEGRESGAESDVGSESEDVRGKLIFDRAKGEVLRVFDSSDGFKPKLVTSGFAANSDETKFSAFIFSGSSNAAITWRMFECYTCTCI